MRSYITVLSVIGALAAPAAAFANDSATDAYGGQGSIVTGVEGGSSTSSPSAAHNTPSVLGATATRSASSNAAPSAVAAVATATPTRAASGGSLPFTGFDVTLMVLGGLALLGLGFGLRRAAGRSTHTI